MSSLMSPSNGLTTEIRQTFLFNVTSQGTTWLWEFAKRHEHLFNDEEIPEPNSLYENGKHGPLKGERYGSSISDRNPRRNMLHQVTREGWPTGIIDTLGMTKRKRFTQLIKSM